MKEKHYSIIGILIIIGTLTNLIVMVINDINIITEPLLTSVSLICVIPISIYYIVVLKLEKEKRKNIVEVDNK